MRAEDFDRNQTLEQLISKSQKENWNLLNGRAWQLFQKPLNEFSKDDLRFMIERETGLEFLIPVAIDILAENPLARGIYYGAGDLLHSVLNIAPAFWKENPNLWFEVEEIAYDAELLVEYFQKNVAPALKNFRQSAPTQLPENE
ncbi:MAG TPA: contact-dependent growth inhibition system immunity protein [Pyrinomonadaceae bacterium]|nr:contact-dependent growth inhibition system immunity protein [Pyrinomonadaceae bacterium]